MCPEGVPRAVDRRDKAIGKVALFEATSQEFAQLVPPGLADFFMEVLASDNGELLRLRLLSSFADPGRNSRNFSVAAARGSSMRR